jgi:hypothetical protein
MPTGFVKKSPALHSERAAVASRKARDDREEEKHQHNERQSVHWLCIRRHLSNTPFWNDVDAMLAPVPQFNRLLWGRLTAPGRIWGDLNSEEAPAPAGKLNTRGLNMALSPTESPSRGDRALCATGTAVRARRRPGAMRRQGISDEFARSRACFDTPQSC